MKNSLTILCCALLAYGSAKMGYSITEPQNILRAQPISSYNIDNAKIVVRDTVKDTKTVRDTVKVKVVKLKYRDRLVRDTVEKEIPVLYTRTSGNRKEKSPDSLLDSKHKRVVKEVIELSDKSETRL